MHEELNNIKLKMKALGFSRQQIESIIEKALSGKDWGELNDSEQQQLIISIDNRITFLRKLLQVMSCNSCRR
ncbi:hypothetical protein [Desulfoscipio sp. XC116]|uniref:hypothetical protein n=1 Tax=Desulfoscipio sp. XC116 TaxID=3144975 RepID=UPI00325AB848